MNKKRRKNPTRKYSPVKEPLSPSSIFNDKSFSKSNKNSRKSIRKLIIEFLKMRDSIRIEISESNIEFFIEGNNFYFNLNIIKEIGFALSMDSMKSNSKHQPNKRCLLIDKKLYEYSLKKSKKVFKKLNRSNMRSLYKEISSDLSLSRNLNLEELLS